MPTQKLIFLGLAGIGLMGLALVLIFVFGYAAVHRETAGAGSLLPLYALDQTASSHDGYRHNTLTSGDDVYVNDYEESALELANPEPTTVIGRCAGFGDIKVCSITGQPVTAYIAGDVGSEMPTYAPYRNVKQKPFDWRTATFREMTALCPGKNPRTSQDSALLAEVVKTLRDGTPIELPDFPFTAMAKLASLKMASDELPGILFCPVIFTDAKGQIYLAESLMTDDKVRPPQLHARWIPAGPALAQWLKTP